MYSTFNKKRILKEIGYNREGEHFTQTVLPYSLEKKYRVPADDICPDYRQFQKASIKWVIRLADQIHMFLQGFRDSQNGYPLCYKNDYPHFDTRPLQYENIVENVLTDIGNVGDHGSHRHLKVEIYLSHEVDGGFLIALKRAGKIKKDILQNLPKQNNSNHFSLSSDTKNGDVYIFGSKRIDS